MGEDVCKVKIICNPIDGNSSDSIPSNSFTDDMFLFCSIRFNPKDSVDFSRIVLNPVD